MLDLINQIRRTQSIEAAKDNRTTTTENKKPAIADLREKWRALRRNSKLVKEWQDYDTFKLWYDAQPTVLGRYFVLMLDPRLPPNTEVGPDTCLIISKGFMEYLAEFRIKVYEGVPVGVRKYRRVDGKVFYSYTSPGGSQRSGRFDDPLECQMAWLKARIAFVERYYPEHGDSPRIRELMDHFQQRHRYHIEHKLEYKIGNWRDQ